MLLGLTGLSVAGAVIVSTCTLCYAVSTDGSPPLAYVQGEDTYQTAVRQVEDQVSEILRSDYRYAQETTMALTIAPKNSLQTSDQLTASLMETVDQVKAEYILTIDGLPIGACESREAIDQALQGIKDTYTNQFTVSAYFDNTVDVVVGYLPAQAEVLGAQALAERLTQPRQQAQPAIEALLQVLEPAQELPRSMETLRAEAQAIDQDQGTLPLLTVCTVEEVTYTQPVEPPVQEVEDSTLLLGEEKVPFPEDGYHGDDIRELAQAFYDLHGDQYRDVEEAQRLEALAAFGLERNIPKMQADLRRYGIEYDQWFFESSLHTSGYVAETVGLLTEKGWTYEKDGALWLNTTQLLKNKYLATASTPTLPPTSPTTGTSWRFGALTRASTCGGPITTVTWPGSRRPWTGWAWTAPTGWWWCSCSW